MAEHIYGKDGTQYTYKHATAPFTLFTTRDIRPYKTIHNYKGSGVDFLYDEQTKRWFGRRGTQIFDITNKFGNNSYTQMVNKLYGSSKGIKQKQNSTSKQVSTGNSTSRRKPTTATAPRSNFSTPTPTYFTSLESGITGHGLDDDQKKYLESLGVRSVRDLQEKLNTDLDSGLVVDNKWGKNTQDAFRAGYKKWKQQQTAPTERPQQRQFDYNQDQQSDYTQLYNQWMKQQQQSPQQEVAPTPPTYDKYDIRHILKGAGAKGVTRRERRALRHWANEGTIAPGYERTIRDYGDLFKPQQQQTPTMNPVLLDYLKNTMGQSYQNLGTTGSNDGMYYFSNDSNQPQQTTSASDWQSKPYGNWSSWATQVNEQLNNRYRLLKKGGYIPKFQTAWGTITDMRNYIPSQNQTPNLPGSIAVAKATTNIRNEEKRRKSSADKRKTKFSKTKNMQKTNIMDLQDQLWQKGFFEGTGLTYDQAVDGIMGKLTRGAMERAKQAGYKETEIGRGVKRETPKPKEQESALDYVYAPGTTPPIVNQLMQEVGSKISSEDKTSEEPEGHAIYLHYPNFVGSSANALKIGNFDVGKAIGNPSIPVGHDAFVLVDPDGTSNYYEYGRYNSGPIIGHKRPTVKGGNWRHIPLPSQQPEENDSVYMSRVQSMLPDTKTGAYQAMTIPHVDTQRATQYVYDQANDPNREEYSINNTCATGACNATLPFRTGIEFHPLQGTFDWGGYSLPAAVWSLVPGSTNSYAEKARTAASNVYVMNDKSEKKKK